MDKNSRTFRILQFLQELAGLRCKVCADMRNYELCVYLNAFDKSKSVTLGMQDNDLMKIKKPKADVENDDDVLRLYKNLHEIYLDMQATGNAKQLYLGNGILKTKDGLNHPLLIRRAELIFDAENSTFYIKAEDDETKLCREIIPKELNHENIIAEIIRKVEDNNIFPIGKDADVFFAETINLLTSQGEYSNCENKGEADKYNVVNQPVVFYADRSERIIKYLDKLQSSDEGEHQLTYPFKVAMNFASQNESESKNNLVEGSLVHPYELNDQQKKAAESILYNKMVVVQGPPGTGKTLTADAAAVVGAQSGKKVLMTAKNVNPMKVMEEMLPQKVRSITAVLDGKGNYDKVSEAIDNVIGYYNKYSTDDIKEKINALEHSKVKLEERIGKYKREKSVLMSDKNFVWQGERMDIVSAGRMMLERKVAMELISNNFSDTLKMSLQDLERLYHTNVITEQEERLFQTSVLEELIKPSQLQQEKANEEESENAELEKISKFLELFKFDKWMITAAVEKENGNYHKLYNALNLFLKEQKTFLDEYSDIEIEIDTKISHEEIKAVFPKIHRSFDENGKMKKTAMMFNPTIKKCMNGILINGEQISSKEDCLAVRTYFIYRMADYRAEELWNMLLVPYDVPEFATVGDRLIYQICGFLECAFDYSRQIDTLKSVLSKRGIDWKRFLCIDRYDTKLVECEKTVDAATSIHDLYMKLSENEEQCFHKNTLDQAKRAAQKLGEYLPDLSNAICEALEKKDEFQSYIEEFSKVDRLLARKETEYARRKTLLKRLYIQAPKLAEAIEKRIGIHASKEIPCEVRKALEGKLLLSTFIKMQDSNIAYMEKELKECRDQLEKKKDELVFWKTLYQVIQKLTNDRKLVEALHTFEFTLQKIGKGKGAYKNVASLRKNLRNSFEEVQQIIPIWIMPTHMILELVQPKTFDVLIVDEASELDITQTVLLNVAETALIIGDEQQVESMAIGIPQNQIKSLQEAYLKDISNRHLYDLRTSLFDLVRLKNHKPIMLVEHFRCHPAIISLSNRLSYNNKLLPLRQPIQSLEPVIGVNVAGKRERRINRNEADAIVERVKSMVQDERYSGMTIGVISLIGREQADLIQRGILKEIPMEIIEKHKICCENAAGLQGEEKDVILISCVDAPSEKSEIMRLKEAGAYDWLKKRLNVSFSRAKTQVWVFHSFQQENLQKEDIRHHILSYIRRSEKYEINNICLTSFEESVAQYFESKGIGRIVNGMNIAGNIIPMIWTDDERMIVLNCRGYEQDWRPLLERAGYEIEDIIPKDFYVSAVMNKDISFCKEKGGNHDA